MTQKNVKGQNDQNNQVKTQQVDEPAKISLDEQKNLTGEQRAQFYGPFFLIDIQIEGSGTIYFVDKPNLLPESAVAARVAYDDVDLKALMSHAFYNGKPVLVAPAQRWHLDQVRIAWTIYAAKMAY
ncbi:MAG: hypothetical protein QG657_2927 [Acidobacteriota bacterium]|nr:hypothetical protein [Acidobacteriota bacterium]